VSGLVVTFPLVGSVPLHPPDAVQDCASVAFHVNVAGVPLATLFALAVRVTVGIAVPTAEEPADWPHAANAANAAHPRVQRTRRDAMTKLKAPRSLLNWVSRKVFKANSRSTKFIMHLPHNSRQAAISVHRFKACSRKPRGHIISWFFTYANMSPFENVSPFANVSPI
jgi:hypothetical protein